MKKTLTILVIVCVLVATLSLGAFALTQDDAGVYQIATADDLIEFRNTATNGASAVLTADIDMTGKEWTPFGQIVISLDGQGHSITGLTATREGSGNIGLFVDFLANNPGNPTIKNVVFKNATLNVVADSTTSCQIGLVAGYADRANVTGITLDNCKMTVNHSGAGELSTGMIAGRAEWNAQDNEIKIDGIVKDNCTFTVNVDAKDNTYVGGIVGSHASDRLAVRNAQFNGTINGTVDPAKVAAIACQMWGPVIMSGNTTTTSYPVTMTPGSILEYFTVATTDELNAAIAKYNSGSIGYAFITVTADMDYEGKTWTPITANFRGELNGQGHTISGIELVYDNAGAGNYGILANAAANGGGYNGRIVNWVVENCSITVNVAEGTEGNVMAGIVGFYDRGHLENITAKNVDVTVNGKSSGEMGAGVICGKAEWAGPNGAVGFYNCTTDKNSSVYLDGGDSTNQRAGGIVGRAGSADRYEIDGCVNYASVYCTHTAAGIIGYSGHWNNPTNVIKNSKNYGTVYGDDVVASIVGPCDGGNVTLENVVAGGFVMGNSEVNAVCRDGYTLNNVRNVVIVNPIGGDSDTKVAPYYQIQTGDGKYNLRVVLLANTTFIKKAGDVSVTYTFSIGDETVKTFTTTLETVYSAVSAGEDYYIAPEGTALFGNIVTNIPANAAEKVSVVVTNGDGDVICSGEGELPYEAPAEPDPTPDPEEPTAICINDIPGVTAMVYAFEKPSEFGGPVGLIYYFDDPTTKVHETIGNAINNGAGTMYAVAKIDGESYKIEQYANGAPWFRLNVETPGAVLLSGVSYEIVVEFYDENDTLVYYTKPETKTSMLSTAGAPEREGQNVTLPEGLTKLTVDTNTLGKEGINVWNESTESVAQLFDGDTVNTKIGGGTTGNVTVTFSLTEAATVSYYTFYTGNDTATSPDRNPAGWTLYGKVGEEWVALSTIGTTATHVTGLEATNATPYSYAVTNKQACTEYKVVFENGGVFQMNELELFA